MRRALALVMAVLLGLSLAGCTGEGEDDDQLLPEAERDGWRVSFVGVDGETQTYDVTSDPGQTDTDGDGLDDYLEFLEQTDPRKPDTDGDGLLDGEDLVLDDGDSRVSRWKEAGIRWTAEADQVRFLGERGDGLTARGGLPTRADTDEDGIFDGDEAAGFDIDVPGTGTVTVQTDVFSPETDGDGIHDGEERRLGLDPTRRDTDQDGIHDRGDINPWYDLTVRFTVEALDLGLPDDAAVWVLVRGLDPLDHRSDTVAAGEAESDPSSLDSPTLDPRDDGGSIVTGRHNVTFLVNLYRDSAEGPEVVDVFSATTGDPWVEAQVHALDGTLTWKGAEGAFHPWPQDGFGGEDGSVQLGVPLVSPPGPMALA